MLEADIFQVLRGAMWTAVLMSAPILVVTLILGFAIGLLQALTSIQEMTLTFIPKIIAVVVVFVVTLGYMTRICIDFFNSAVLPMITV